MQERVSIAFHLGEKSIERSAFMPVTEGSRLSFFPEVHWTRLLLLLLLFIATSTEAMTLGVGLWQEEKDQVHECVDMSDTSEEREATETRGAGDDAVQERADLDRVKGGVWQERHPAWQGPLGARPCGKLRRHRWANVDLN